MQRVEAGWKAVKLNGAPRVGWLEPPARIAEIIAEVAMVRDAVGWDVGIGLDFHGRVHKGLAKTLIKELEPRVEDGLTDGKTLVAGKAPPVTRPPHR